MTDTPEKAKHETQDERMKRLKAERAAERENEIAAQIAKAKKGGLGAKALDLYTKALNERQSLTLIPKGKLPNDKEGTGNHLVEVELVDGKPVEFDGMVVVRHL